MSEGIEVRASITEPDTWVGDIKNNGFVQPDGTSGMTYHFNTEADAQKAADLYEAKQHREFTAVENSEARQFIEHPNGVLEIRQFESGATRDADADKFDYEGFLSPIVLRRYAEYMHKHRKQSDGKLRASDNWQKGIPIVQYMKSKWRHFMDTWSAIRMDIDPEYGPCMSEDLYELEESLCAELFNTSGMLHEILKSKGARCGKTS